MSDDRKLVDYTTARFGGPAFIRRQREVDAAWEQVIAQANTAREEYLAFVRQHLHKCGSMFEVALDAEPAQAIQQLKRALSGKRRLDIPKPAFAVLRDLSSSIERFNKRWQAHLDKIDLTGVNKQREDYNQWFRLEKECAVRSEALAEHGFAALAPKTVADVQAALPLLSPLPFHATLLDYSIKGLACLLIFHGLCLFIMSLVQLGIRGSNADSYLGSVMMQVSLFSGLALLALEKRLNQMEEQMMFSQQ